MTKKFKFTLKYKTLLGNTGDQIFRNKKLVQYVTVLPSLPSYPSKRKLSSKGYSHKKKWKTLCGTFPRNHIKIQKGTAILIALNNWGERKRKN